MKQHVKLWAVAATVGLTALSAAADLKAYLGVGTSPAPAILSEQLNLGQGMGLVVDYIDADSPAATGLQPRDILHKVDEQLLVSPYQLAVLIRSRKPGDVVILTVIRGGKPKDISVTLSERDLPPLAPPGMVAPRMGNQDNPFGLPPGHPPIQRQAQPWSGINAQNFGQTLDEILEQLNQAGQHVNKNIDDWVKHFQPPPQPNTPRVEDDKVIIELHDDADQTDAEAHSSSSQSKMSVQVKHDGSSLTRKVDMVENDLKVTFRAVDEDKHLKAERDGKVLFDGPVNTPEERAAVPAEVRPLLKRAEDGVSTQIIHSGGKGKKPKKANRNVISL